MSRLYHLKKKNPTAYHPTTTTAYLTGIRPRTSIDLTLTLFFAW